MERRIRVHGNFAEYVPLALLLLLFMELQAQSRFLVHVLCIVLIAARLVHADRRHAGQRKHSPMRVAEHG